VQVDSRLHCSDTATHHGQEGSNGEEEKSSEEGQEDETPEEEVASAISRSSTYVGDCVMRSGSSH
jgi:hypothetical protein